jgi:hypothetical protein
MCTGLFANRLEYFVVLSQLCGVICLFYKMNTLNSHHFCVNSSVAWFTSSFSVFPRPFYKTCLRTGCCGECLDLRGSKWWETGEDYIKRGFINCTVHQILLG